MILLWFAVSQPATLEAQLISPGKLSTAHSKLEGMANCTQCHQLRTPGADPTRCLQCHEFLNGRIEAGNGYHGRLPEQECGACHKEHLGVDFHLVRMDPDTFPHRSTGYLLQGGHQQTACGACHTPERVSDPSLRRELAETDGLDRTYLGLDRRCGSCHENDDPHGGQFAGDDCGTCHTEEDWKKATAFDHTQASYPLDGSHRDVKCESCHGAEQAESGTELIRYTPVAASDCSPCHDDPHDGEMAGRCAECHETSGWSRVNRSRVESVFDHGATEFPLVGAHSRSECRMCHSQVTESEAQLRLAFAGGLRGHAYPAPEHETCTSCHLDTHDGTFEDRSCDLCHSQDSWAPPDYDRARHQMELRFDLSGAHEVTPCSACHETGEGSGRRFVFTFEDPGSCSVCHEADDPHEGGFRAPACDRCHDAAVFQLERFDHQLLAEAGWVGLCGACHEEDDPHGGQFPTSDCGDCHATEAYEITDFDHAATRFTLEGAHADVPCADCHVAGERPGGGSMIRYRPLDPACISCHGGGR